MSRPAMGKFRLREAARILHDAVDPATDTVAEVVLRDRLARDLGQLFADMNDQFDWPTWLKACGVDGAK